MVGVLQHQDKGLVHNPSLDHQPGYQISQGDPPTCKTELCKLGQPLTQTLPFKHGIPLNRVLSPDGDEGSHLLTQEQLPYC